MAINIIKPSPFQPNKPEVKIEEILSYMQSNNLLENITKRPGKLVGIINYGTNCYVNAGLQCLLCIPELNGYFLDELFNNITIKTKCENKSVCKMVANLYKEIFSGKVRIVSPMDFIDMCSPGQQDVHEFLWKKFLTQIQDETNPNIPFKLNPKWNSDEIWTEYIK